MCDHRLFRRRTSGASGTAAAVAVAVEQTRTTVDGDYLRTASTSGGESQLATPSADYARREAALAQRGRHRLFGGVAFRHGDDPLVSPPVHAAGAKEAVGGQNVADRLRQPLWP